jgi:hypothetical protein
VSDVVSRSRKIASFGFDNKPQKKSVMRGCVRGAALPPRIFTSVGRREMLQFLRIGVAVLAVAGFAFASFGMRPAQASCQLVTATHSAPSKAELACACRSERLSAEKSERLELRFHERTAREGRPVLEGGSSERRARRCAAQARSCHVCGN